MKGHHYIMVIDKYSWWCEVKPLSPIKTVAVIEHLRGIFAYHGIPDQVSSGNGPQFQSSEFKSFASTQGFESIIPSPHFHQANGKVEIAVEPTKKRLAQKDPAIAFLNYHNTPHSAMYLPANTLKATPLTATRPQTALC